MSHRPVAAPLPRRIGVSLGNLERFVDGLGEYSCQLVSALAAQAPRLRQAHGIELWVHCVPALHGRFGPEVRYLPVNRLQEVWHRAPVRLDLWHALSQLNRYGPPGGQALRLVTVHDLNHLYSKHGLSLWRHRWRLRRLLAGQDAVVAISRHTATDVQRECHWRGPLHVVHNGVRDLSNDPRTPVPGLVPGQFLYHLSRMTPSKNVESLIRMMAQWPDKLLVLAGPSAARNAELAALARTMGAANVRLLTGVEEGHKAWLYAHCEAFLFPSLTEGFGLPPVEAMHFGAPVVLSDRTSLPEVGGDAAFYWHDFEPLAMRQVVEQALRAHTPARAQAVRSHAARFTWPRAAAACIDLYLGMLGLGAAPEAAHAP